MKSLKITFAALTLTLFANFSMAQSTNQKATPEQKAQRQTERLAEELTLTKEQQVKVQEINLAIINKNAGVRNDNSLSEETKKQSFKGNEDARKQMIKALLTPEQSRKFDEMEAKRTGKEHELPKDLKKAEDGRTRSIKTN